MIFKYIFQLLFERLLPYENSFTFTLDSEAMIEILGNEEIFSMFIISMRDFIIKKREILSLKFAFDVIYCFILGNSQDSMYK